jgi:D-sedoheptulose 7-phosphate isomerase
MKGAAEVSIIVASKDTPRVQESHIMIGHILCGLIEDAACGK